MSSRHRLVSRQSKTFTRRRRERMSIVIGALVITLIAITFGFSRLTMISALTIDSIAVEGTEGDADLAQTLRAVAEEAIGGEYLGLFSRSNILIYPRRRIEAATIAASPRIMETDVRALDRRTIAVTVRQRDPSAVVCASLPDFDGATLAIDEAKSCYFADAEGLLYRVAPQFSGYSHRRYYIPSLATSSPDAEAGVLALDPTRFRALQDLYDAVRAHGILAEAILVKDDGEYELYARNLAVSEDDQTASTVVIYFSAATDLTEEIANLVSFWEHMMRPASSDNQPVSFEYIDVRYGPNVFYRTI